MFLNEYQFQFMYHEGAIQLINSEGGSNIDDFEDDSIRGKDALGRVVIALDDFKSQFKDSPQLEVMDSLIGLFSEAIKRNTGVYFYF